MSEGFLSRWARVKAAANKAEPESPLPAPAEGGEEAEIDQEQTISELPSIESLTKDSDFSAFLGAGVPEALRKAALAKLWASDPLFSRAEVYDLHMEDYNQPALTEAVKTAWQFGKGMVEKLDDAVLDGEPVNFTDNPEKTQSTAEEKECAELLRRTNAAEGADSISKD